MPDPTTLTPFQWALEHIQIIGWPAVVWAVWKFSQFLNGVSNRAAVVESQVNTLATNHFPHMEASLGRLVELAEAQDSRMNAWMAAQAASGSHHKEQ